MGTGRREIPYSLVSGLDPEALNVIGGEDYRRSIEAPIIVSDWAARDLHIRTGDPLTMEYYVWQDEGRLTTQTAEFQVAGVVALEGVAADPDFAPNYPGISESEDVGDWEPPFPVDLSKIRDIDEEYWDRYRTTPKAFIPLAKGQELWQNRYGRLTSIRVRPGDNADPDAVLQTYRARLRDELDPFQAGFSIYPVRDKGLSASRGATDFGEYFVYFSFFLVVSALLLTGLFFKLGVEQRLREVGILNAMGFTPGRIRSAFLAEGTVLAVAGAILGLIGALAYAGIIMVGLRTWWIDAVGTRLLALHVSPLTMALGGAGGIIAALMGIAWTLRGLRPLTPRALLMGSTMATGTRGRVVSLTGIASAILALILLIGSMAGWMSQVAGFFGAGSLLLVAFLCHLWIRLSGTKKNLLAGTGARALSKLGFRNATFRPGRSLLSVALIAFASFVIVAVDAFRLDEDNQALDWHSGNGGYPLLAESLLPLHWDPNTAEGRQELDLDDPALEQVRFTSFRLRPGDDTSCLNLYRPSNPRILAPPPDFLEAGRFAFRSSLAETDEEKENPWLLLAREESDGAVPVIGNANSMTYVLHLGLGEEFLLPRSGDEPLRLKLVATLADSVLQSELLMSEENFLRLFPGYGGFRFFLLESAPDQSETVTEILEQRLSDSGFDVSSTTERLAGFHRVENTYLSTFQTLGGLGLVLGTLGLAAVMLRNIFERRRELALLRAVGYGTGHFSVMVLAENILLLFWGLLIGSVCALIAIAPAVVGHGGSFSLISLGLLLLAVLGSGLTASVLAVVASTRTALLPALRAE
jgi:ABC-type antimicrobial peptide transport system permease subunit